MNILKRPMFFAALVCSLASGVSFCFLPLSFVIIAIAIATLIFVSVYYKKYKYITVIIAVLWFAICLFTEFKKINNIKTYDTQKVTGSFFVCQEPTDHGLFNSVTLKEINCDTLPSNIKLLAFDYNKSMFKMGDVVNATLKLSFIDKYDKYRISNYSNEIYATANAIEIDFSGECNYFYKIAGNIRSYVKSAATNRFEGDTSGLLLALTTGDKTLLSDDFLGNVKTTGISHVVVVSGMHLSIIMLAVFWCLGRLFYNKYIRCLVSLVAVFAICAVCGFTMSIIRAGAMFVVAGLASVFNRDNDSLNSLLTAVTAILISAPFAIFNVSFQLSVLSTLSIIWAMPFYSNTIKEKLKIKSKIIVFLIDTILCSTLSIIFTLPICIKTFGYASVVSPITNLIISYPVILALISNIVALIVSVIPVVKIFSNVLFWIAGISSKTMVFSVNKIANLPITVAVLPKNAFWWSLAIIASVIGCMYFLKFKKEKK